MKSKRLYDLLEKEFILQGLTDDWAANMDSIKDFISDNFKKRSMGLVCDFATEVNKVYTAVFPSKKVMQEILDKGTEDAMLFVHHPSIWDIRKAPEVFYQMDRELLQKFKEKRISIYNLHVPLDNYGQYSTGVSLARALGMKVTKSFAQYFGGMAGVFGKTEITNVQDLKKKFEQAVKHEVKLYNYGNSNIDEGRVAICAGGGNSVEILEEIAKEGIGVLITGITAKTEHSKAAHEFAEKNKINLLGGTHYSTETFACREICNYFQKFGLPSEFIDDAPVMEDM